MPKIGKLILADPLDRTVSRRGRDGIPSVKVRFIKTEKGRRAGSFIY